jgi:ribosomal protein S18 acetylase RimI-like enzyme
VTEPLDRPVWHALTGRQARLAVDSRAAVRIDPAYGPFAAAVDESEEAQAALLATLCGSEDRIAIIERGPWPAPCGTQVAGEGELVQMVFEGELPEAAHDPRIVLLGEGDAAEMAALALATEPGPWSSATHRYGDYFGIRIDGRLAAMAGERMLLPGLAEVSGVCAWPEFRGQGLATLLMHRVMRGFAARGDQPFLHCYAWNTGAIRLYEALGFRIRARLALTILALA